MRRNILLFFLSLIICFSSKAQYKYPYSKTIDSSDTWHSVTVKDPYRWLEDLKNQAVINWFKAQATFTDSVMSNMPFTEEIYNELIKLDVAEPEKKYSVRKMENSIFYAQVKSSEGKLKLYRKFDNEDSAQVIATPDMWGKDFRIVNYELDPTGQYLAIIAQEGGKEYNDAKIYSVNQNKILPDIINGNYKGMVINQLGTVYYWQTPSYDPHDYNNPNDYVFKKHTIGTDTTEDKVWVSKLTNPELMNFTNGNYLWEITTFQKCGYEFAIVAPAEIWYRNPIANQKWQKLFAADDHVYTINYYNNKIYYPTFKNAPNGKFMELDLSNTNMTKKTIIPEQIDPMDGSNISQTKNYLIVQFTKNGVKTYTKFFHLPTKKIVNSLFKENTSKIHYSPQAPQKNDSVLIIRQDWAKQDYLMNGVIGSATEIPNKYYPNEKPLFKDNLLVDEIEIPSYDGTLIPLTIIRRKDLKMNGNNVALIQGYAAYGNSYSPSFNKTNIILANKGVVICIAHPRGGGEKGDNWRIGGLKQSKPNTWKDFNACAEHLINKGYTSPNHLCCTAASAGGILIGRAITERPDLWACAIPEAAVLNVIRGQFSAYGKSQNEEFGALDNINDFFSMLENDAVLHIQNGVKYPAILVITGWEDPRVSSWQSGKFAAAAQNANKSGKPILLKVNFKGGHFSGNTSDDRQTIFREEAKKNAFILWQCDYQNANKYN